MANCLVLGGNGLIGSFIAELLAEKGCPVMVFDSFRGKDNLQGIKSVERVEGDYLKAEDVKNSLKGIDIVFHCIHTTVPRSSLGKAVFDAETNILPALKLFGDAVEAGVKKVVYLSSLAVYGQPSQVPVKETSALKPISPYGVSKLAIENYLGYFNTVAGLDYAILRPASAYGERQAVSADTGVLTNFVYNAVKGNPLLIYGDGSAKRNLLHARDVAVGAVEAAFKETDFKAFNLGAAEGISIRQLAEKVCKAVGKEVEIKFVERENEVKDLVCDSSRAFECLGWKPEISLDEGIRRCVQRFEKEFGKT